MDMVFTDGIIPQINYVSISDDIITDNLINRLSSILNSGTIEDMVYENMLTGSVTFTIQNHDHKWLIMHVIEYLFATNVPDEYLSISVDNIIIIMETIGDPDTIKDKQIITERQPTIPTVSDTSTTAELATAINSIISTMQTHGLIE